MVRQWIAGAALFALISGYSWAEVAQPSDNILKEQFSKQYHGILKLDSITLKNLDSTGNQATWSAEGIFLPVKICIPALVWRRIIILLKKPGPRSSR